MNNIRQIVNQGVTLQEIEEAKREGFDIVGYWICNNGSRVTGILKILNNNQHNIFAGQCSNQGTYFKLYEEFDKTNNQLSSSDWEYYVTRGKEHFGAPIEDIHRSNGNRHDPDIKIKVMELASRGVKRTYISEKLNVSLSTIKRWLKEPAKAA